MSKDLINEMNPVAGDVTKKKYVISKNVDQLFTGIYEVYIFIGQFFKQAFSYPFELKELINQCYQVGYKSLALISLLSLFVFPNLIIYIIYEN